MPQSEDTTQRQAAQSAQGREIADAMTRARKVLNRYDHLRKQLASRDVNPDTDGELYRLHIQLDSAVMDAYTTLRKYLKDELDEEFWNTRVVGWEGDETPIILGGPDGEHVNIDDDEYDIEATTTPDNVRFLEDYQGTYEESSHREWVRFEGWTTVTKRQPTLLPVSAYRRTVQLLDEARNHLGFAPEAKESVPRTEITEEMFDAVDEWWEANVKDGEVQKRWQQVDKN